MGLDENGAAAFLLVYLLFVIAIGLAQPLDRWWHTSMRYASPLLIAVVLMHSLGLIALA